MSARHRPTYGRTAMGLPVHAHTTHYTSSLSFRALRDAVKATEGFNAKFAVVITSAVGTMACAYLFAALALVSAPDKFAEGKKGAIEWIAQTFLQLVLLSVIMVGQRVAGKAADARSAKQFEDTEAILDQLDLHTEGGLADVRADLAKRIDNLAELVTAAPPPPSAPPAPSLRKRPGRVPKK